MVARIACILLAATMTVPASAAEPVLLYAAGSLRSALNEVAAAFERAFGQKVQAKFGASGTLKDEIAGGARAEVFASANMEHPQALATAGKAGPPVLFARNRLCALVRPGLAVDSADAARSHARRRREARHLDAARRPLRRLRLGGFPQGRQAQARRLRGAGEEGAATGRRSEQPNGAAGKGALWNPGGRGQGRPLPHLLHQCARGAGAERRTSRSWRCRRSWRSAPTMASP